MTDGVQNGKRSGVEPYPLHLRGDADEVDRRNLPLDPRALSDSARVGSPVRFDLIDSATFANAQYTREWLIRRILVRDQPAVIGGPKKSLKTSLLVDLALSLGSGGSFLGQFPAAQTRVAILSGESGEATLQETARRVSAAKRIDLSRADVLWGFRLPHLTNPDHLSALRETVQRCGIRVLLIDPLYLSLLAGASTNAPQASNLYEIGPLLMSVAKTCLEVACTPVFVHHFKLNRASPHEEPQLDDLAFSGIQEFARQWILVGRRERYEPGSGQHKLWLAVGGSVGHSGLWAVDINEGAIDEDFRGRGWDVTVQAATEARRDHRAAKDAKKAARRDQQDRDDEARLLGALDRMDPNRTGAGYERLRALVGFGATRMTRTVERLQAGGAIEPCEVIVGIGSNARRPARGLRRPKRIVDLTISSKPSDQSFDEW